MKITDKYFIMKMLEAIIVGVEFCILILTAFMLKLAWAEITSLQLVSLGLGLIGLIGLIGFLSNAEAWTLKLAAKAGIAITLTCLYMSSQECAECAVETFKIMIILIGLTCIAAILAQVVIAKLISRDRAQNK